MTDDGTGVGGCSGGYCDLLTIVTMARAMVVALLANAYLPRA